MNNKLYILQCGNVSETNRDDDIPNDKWYEIARNDNPAALLDVMAEMMNDIDDDIDFNIYPELDIHNHWYRVLELDDDNGGNNDG